MPKSHVPHDEDALDKFLDKLDGEADDQCKDRLSEQNKAVRLFNSGSNLTNPPENPLFQANLIKPEIQRNAALLTEMKPRLDVQPRRNGLTTTARVCKETIAALWDSEHMQMVLEQVIMNQKVLKAGFLFIGWNPEADFGDGNIALIAPDPRAVAIDPGIQSARDADQAQWWRIKSVVPLWQAQRNYPHVADDLKSGGKIVPWDDRTSPAGGNVPGSRVIGAVQQAWHGVRGGEKTGVPRIELTEYWLVDPATDDDDNPLYPNGRVFVRAPGKSGSVICNRTALDGGGFKPGEPNPFYDGKWPFEWLDGEVDFCSPWGKSELEAMRYIQGSFNRLGRIANEVMSKAAQPIIVADQNALPPEAINTLRQLGWYVVEKSPGREVNITPPVVPLGQLQSFMGFDQGLIEYVGGLQDAGGAIPAKGRAEVRSGAMLEGLQQASQVLVRAQARRVEAFMERVGQKIVSRIFQFLSENRIMLYAGDGETKQYEFERTKLLEEIVKLAYTRVKEQYERDRKRDRDEDTALRAVGALPLARNTVPLAEHLDADQVLLAIKGAWREVQFKVQPMSSLQAARIARAQLMQQLHQQFLIPSEDVLRELDIDNASDKLKQVKAELVERQSLGLPPPGPPQKPAKSGTKK